MWLFIIDIVLEGKFKEENRARKEDGQVVGEGSVNLWMPGKTSVMKEDLEPHFPDICF